MRREGLDLIDVIKKSLSYNFDILSEHVFYDYGFDIIAKATLENFRTIFSAIKFDHFYSYEFSLVKYLDKYSLAAIKEIIELIKKEYSKLFTPSQDVIGTTITLIFISPEVDKKGVEFIEHFHYQKSFLLGLKGKYEIRIIFFDIKNKKVYTNKKAVSLKKHYEKILNREEVIDGDSSVG